MQWRAFLAVSDVDVHTTLVEVVDAKRLVLLGGYMHGGRTELVLNIEVSTCLFAKEAQDMVVAMPGGEVQSCKVVFSRVVDPSLDPLDLASRHLL